MKTQKISGKVIKVGRKWLKVVQEGRNENYPEDLLINELTSSLKAGDAFKDLLVETVCERQYRGGYKFTHTATSENAIRKKEISKWWGYVKDTYIKEERVYANGVAKLHELSCHDYDEQIAEMQKEVDINRAIYWIRHNFKNRNRIYQKGIETLKRYGIHDYDNEIEEMKKEISIQNEIEESKYVYWDNRADYTDRVPNGTIVVTDNAAIKVISSRYCKGEDSFYPWATYSYKGINVTDTEEGRKAIEEYKEKEEKAKKNEENRRKKNDLIESIKKMIKENDVLKGEQVDIPHGRRVIDTFNIYGGGNLIIDDGTYAWYIINNGTDGSFWEINHIRTGGAGAYGYKCELSLVSELLNELKGMEISI